MDHFRRGLWWTLSGFGGRSVATAVSFLPPYRDTLFYAGPDRTGAGKRCAITIDDTPGHDLDAFREMLDILREHGARCTLFVIADENVMSPEGARLLRQAVDDGHELANHGAEDAPMVSWPRDRVTAALATWETRVQAAVSGTAARWFRAPCGLMSTTMASVVAEQGYTSVLCDVYSDDPGIDNAPFHTAMLLKGMKDGSVAVLHAPDRPSRRQTLDVLREALPELTKRGFRTTTLSELFADHPLPVVAEAMENHWNRQREHA
mmetsp:Transcript_22478/g.50641  ORF Transcript_22478/g.50641 Transcript_22478/m.50641 type:complete len:263 (+) Transcript_22478:21-809(+)